MFTRKKVAAPLEVPLLALARSHIPIYSDGSTAALQQARLAGRVSSIRDCQCQPAADNAPLNTVDTALAFGSGSEGADRK